MTRGKILFLEEGKVYCTTEFNGDMYPEGHGDEIIAWFEEGFFSCYAKYERFVYRFNKRNFGYEEPLISLYESKENMIDVRKNWTDYLYIINKSELEWRIVDKKENPIVIPDKSLTIVYFQEVEQIISESENDTEPNTPGKFV